MQHAHKTFNVSARGAGDWRACCGGTRCYAFCFDTVTHGSIAEGAQLEILDKPGEGWCAEYNKRNPTRFTLFFVRHNRTGDCISFTVRTNGSIIRQSKANEKIMAKNLNDVLAALPLKRRAKVEQRAGKPDLLARFSNRPPVLLDHIAQEPLPASKQRTASVKPRLHTPGKLVAWLRAFSIGRFSDKLATNKAMM